MSSSSRRRTAAASSFGPFRHRRFTLVWTAGLISIAGDWALRIALPIVVLQITGSPAATSGVVVAGVLPTLLGPIAGVFVDRWCRRRVLVVANLLQMLAVLPLVAVHDAGSVWIVYAVAFAESALARFTSPAENALLPQLVPPSELLAANSLNAVNNNIARLVGPAIGGVVAAWSGLAAVALVDAVTFGVAAGLVALVGGRFVAERTEAPTGHSPVRAVLHDLAGGLAAIRRDRVVFVLIAVFTLTGIGEGIMGSLMAVFVDQNLHGGATEYGWLNSAQAIGGIAGGLAGGWVGARITPIRLITVGFIVFGAVDLALFTYPWIAPVLWPGLVFFALAGIPATITMSAMMARLQASLPDVVRGRVFAAAETSRGIAMLLGAVIAAVFASHVGALTLLIVQGAGLVAAGVVVGVLLRERRLDGTRDLARPEADHVEQRAGSSR